MNEEEDTEATDGSSDRRVVVKPSDQKRRPLLPGIQAISSKAAKYFKNDFISLSTPVSYPFSMMQEQQCEEIDLVQKVHKTHKIMNPLTFDQVYLACAKYLSYCFQFPLEIPYAAIYFCQYDAKHAFTLLREYKKFLRDGGNYSGPFDLEILRDFEKFLFYNKKIYHKNNSKGVTLEEVDPNSEGERGNAMELEE